MPSRAAHHVADLWAGQAVTLAVSAGLEFGAWIREHASFSACKHGPCRRKRRRSGDRL